jgi:hypothetical protein
MAYVLLFAAVSILGVAPAEALSNAAKYLIDQQIAEACEGRGGTIAADAVIERDLTGNGRADLIISHDGTVCTGLTPSIF